MSTEITITIQEFRNPHGKGWLFIDNSDGRVIAEVDKRKDSRKYEVFLRSVMVGEKRTRLDALNCAIDIICEEMPGVVVKFRQSVVVIKER